MKASAALVGLAAALALAGCGGGASYPSKPTMQGLGEENASGVWVFRPAGKPKAVVIFFHGQGGTEETLPANHRPWIDHLVSRGDIVVYPRYELSYERGAMQYVIKGLHRAQKAVDLEGLPVLSLGYSRGGALAVEYAADAEADSAPVPGAVLSVFPSPEGDMTSLIDFSNIPKATKILFLEGSEDTVVGGDGVHFLLQRLQRGAFPVENVNLEGVSSHGTFVANHFAPMGATAPARRAFWAPADKLVDYLRNRSR